MFSHFLNIITLPCQLSGQRIRMHFHALREIRSRRPKILADKTDKRRVRPVRFLRLT
jgi:hypothetical protein